MAMVLAEWKECLLVEVDLVDAHGCEHDDRHDGQDQDGGRVFRRFVLRQVVDSIYSCDDGDQNELQCTAEAFSVPLQSTGVCWANVPGLSLQE